MSRAELVNQAVTDYHEHQRSHAKELKRKRMMQGQLTWESELQKRIARKLDPITSSMGDLSNVSTIREGVLRVLKDHGPATDEMIENAYANNHYPPASSSGLRTRRSELVRQGLVKDSRTTRKTASGRQAVVWCLK